MIDAATISGGRSGTRSRKRLEMESALAHLLRLHPIEPFLPRETEEESSDIHGVVEVERYTFMLMPIRIDEDDPAMVIAIDAVQECDPSVTDILFQLHETHWCRLLLRLMRAIKEKFPAITEAEHPEQMFRTITDTTDVIHDDTSFQST